MLQFAEGFDSINLVGQSFDSSANVSNGLALPLTPAGPNALWLGSYGRFGSGGILFSGSSSSSGGQLAYAGKNMAGNPQTVIIGFALNILSFPQADFTIFNLYDGQNSAVQMDFRVTSTGNIKATRGGTLLGTSSTSLSLSTWNYVELKATIDPSAGVVSINFNGVNVLSLTGQNTRSTTASQVTAVNLGQGASNSGLGFANGGQFVFDDLYILDGTGASMNSFLGDIRVLDLSPISNGDSTQFAANGAATNFEATADRMPDEDQTFVSSPTAGQVDLYHFESCPMSSGSIVGVALVLRGRRDDAATHMLGGVCKSGTTSSLNSVQPALGNSYQNYQFFFPTDPNTGAAWSISGINAAQFGPEVVS